MGIFDKRDPRKRKDDFDSPVERVDLGGPPATGYEPPAAAQPPEAGGPPLPGVAPAPAAEPPRAAARPSVEADDYGIEKAIELMRTLPVENVELVVQVVKFSLESVGIKLPTIIEDAIRRQKDIQGKISVRRSEIADLEQEIKVRQDEIAGLEADYSETTMVRERLELAEQIGKKRDGEPKETRRPTQPTSPPVSSTLAPLAPTKK